MLTFKGMLALRGEEKKEARGWGLTEWWDVNPLGMFLKDQFYDSFKGHAGVN